MLFVAFCLGEPSFGCLCVVVVFCLLFVLLLLFLFGGNHVLAIYLLLFAFLVGGTLFLLAMVYYSCCCFALGGNPFWLSMFCFCRFIIIFKNGRGEPYCWLYMFCCFLCLLWLTHAL